MWTVAFTQSGGRDYSLVGEADVQEAGKIRYIGAFRGWAAIAALLLAVLAALSWPNSFYVLAFLVGSVAFAIAALVLHLTRPVVETE
jgi:hypothetical protein